MIRLAILGFAGGAAWLQTQAALPPLAWFWLVPPAMLGAAWLPGCGRARILKLVVTTALAFALGFLYAAWRADLRLADALPSQWEGRDVELLGRVIDLPADTLRGQRFRFGTERSLTRGFRAPALVRLQRFETHEHRAMVLHGGDCVALTARLSRPHGQINPGGFDYEAWLLERGIRATGYVKGGIRLETGCGRSWRAGLDRLRDDIRGRLGRALSGRPYAGVVAALAVGDQNAISTAQWTLFRHTGVTHLLSISGLHVTLFSTLVFALVSAVWRRFPGLCLRLPARKAGLIFGLAAAAAYAMLAGFGIPAQRTLYMLGAVAVSIWLGRTTSPTRILMPALGVVVLVDPWAALSPGFWLSFGAVAALFYAGSGRLVPPPLWQGWVRAQWAVTLVLLPGLLTLFHEVSLVSPLANAFAIPLVSFVAVPCVLLAAFIPWDALALAAHAVLSLIMAVLKWLDHLPQPVWHGAQAGPAAIALAVLGALLLLLPRGIPARWLGLVLFLPLLFPRLQRPPPGELWLTVLDVGQGLAAVVRTHGHVLAYDTGPLYPSGDDAGARVVAPYLYARGIDRLDGMIISHDDTDHSGGSLSLEHSEHPTRVWSPLAKQPELGHFGHRIVAAIPDMQPCVAGQAWRWDGVAFEMLHPPKKQYASHNYSDNGRGCVLRVQSAYGSVLLPADIERLGELSLLERVPDRLRADVLVAPHHGSASSSMPPFLAAVRPEWVLIPVGHHNRYGHPAPRVLRRYRAIGARILRTDRDGALEIRLTAKGIKTKKAREDAPRYWRDR